MMEIRLIAADLDGTLLNEAGEVSELTQRVLLRAQRDGIRIVWATGRDLPHFATVREALHTDIFAQNFYIALNGALIVNCGIGAEQRTDGFAADNVDPFLQIADAYDLEALSYTRNGCFRYAQPGFEQLRFEYLKEHSLAIRIMWSIFSAGISSCRHPVIRRQQEPCRRWPICIPPSVCSSCYRNCAQNSRREAKP